MWVDFVVCCFLYSKRFFSAGFRQFSLHLRNHSVQNPIRSLKVSKRHTSRGHLEGERPGGLLELIFAGYVPLASQNPYPIIVYSVAIL